MSEAAKTIRLSDGEVKYWEHNSDKPVTLVLVHGITGSHEGFQYLVPLLGDYHLIVPDLPGFGISPLPHENLTLAEEGKLLVEFIKKLQLKSKPYIIGHSMGSLVVTEALQHDPDVAQQKLILLSPVPLPIGLLDTRKVGALATQLYYTVSKFIPSLATSKRITKLTTSAMITTTDPDLTKAIYGHHYGNLDYISSITWYGRLYREVNKRGMSSYKDVLAQFDTLIVSGDRDIVTPIKHQKIAAKQLGITLQSIPGVGHLAHYERPQELVDAIRQFID